MIPEELHKTSLSRREKQQQKDGLNLYIIKATMKFNFGLLPALTLFGSLSVITARTPILLVPGLSGSQLWGTVKNQSVICDSNTSQLLWFGVKTPFCSSTLELQYNESNNTYSDKEGVNVSVPGFGETSSVECLNDNVTLCKIKKLQYLKDFVDYFVARGYQRGVTIRAAPYDWRLAADSLATRGYFNKLKTLVEEMYNQNNDTPVALVVHSMGGPMSLYFLNSKLVTQEWKDKYIKVYIPLSGAFAGASKSLEAVVSGILPLDWVLKLESETIQFGLQLERSLESLYWLMPRAEAYGHQVLVQTPTANYTARDYQQMFTTFANYSLGWTKYMPTSTINAGYPFPKVPTHCFYGSNISTPLTFVYSRNDTTQAPTIINGSGDGTVNKASLEVCLRWAESPGFHSRAFPGVEHHDMVINREVLNAIREIVMADPPSSSVIPTLDIYTRQ